MGVDTVAAILLAAGSSTRFGAANKLAAPLGGVPLALHAATTLASIPFARRIVVCADPLPVDWAPLGFEAVCATGERRLSASIAAGIAALRASDCTACLIALADMPFVPRVHFEALAVRDEPVVATGAGGRGMVPALFGRESWDALASLSGDEGARTLLRGAPRVEAATDWLIDIDTAADLAAASAPPPAER